MNQKAGKQFEADFKAMAADLYRQGGPLLRKIDMPLRVFKQGGRTRVVFLKNSFADFVGCWRAKSGRMVIVECKHTVKPQLPVGGSSGLNKGQLDSMLLWRSQGAACLVAWLCDGTLHLVDLPTVLSVLPKRKHLLPEDAFKYLMWPCDAEHFAAALEARFGQQNA